MAVGPDPFVALLQSISDAQAASGAGAGAPFAPGAQGITPQGVQAGDANGGPPGAVASIGAGGGSVPGTATTGTGLANQIIEGAINPGGAVAQGLFGRVERSGERPEQPTVAGGDIGALMAVLGGPLAAMTLLPSLVVSDAMGGPLDPGLLGAGSLAELAAGATQPFGGNPPLPPPLPPSRQGDGREDFGQVRTGQVPVPSRPPRDNFGDRQRENFGQTRTDRAPTPPRDPRR